MIHLCMKKIIIENFLRDMLQDSLIDKNTFKIYLQTHLIIDQV
jgi:hypothetical protein